MNQEHGSEVYLDATEGTLTVEALEDSSSVVAASPEITGDRI
ncbi:MAG: hypothetical protein QF437_12015 [Planctomycetota bacterium]|nr:hypothetical protein [Planctomycetota bacterium]MDP7131210.1 hypothetical protein [Planctomycetota bacterium]